MATHTIDDIVRIYVKMRDAKSELTAKYEAEKKEIEEKMSRVEGKLLVHLNTNGLESMRTEHGTVYKSIKTKPSIRDFNALKKWILSTGNVEILQKRISTTSLRDGEEIPDGVEVLREAEVGVRRS